MRKKILAVVLSVSMVSAVITGCGGSKKANSDYFKEVKEMSQIQTGTVTEEMSFTYKGEGLEAYPQLLDKDGNASATIKADCKVVSDSEVSMDFDVKLGTSSEYTSLTKLVYKEGKLYASLKPVVNMIATFDNEAASSVTQVLSTYGISDYVVMDVSAIEKKLTESTGDKETFDMKKANASAVKLMEEIFDVLSKDFKGIIGHEDDYYTLKINEGNADKAVDGVIKLVNNDAEKIYDKFIDFAKDFYGADSDTVKQLQDNKVDAIQSMKDAVNGSEDETVDTKEYSDAIKDAGIDVSSKIAVSGKKGSREADWSIDLKELEIEDGIKIAMGLKATIKEGDVEIKDEIPTDAVDVTAILTALFSYGEGNGDGDGLGSLDI